VLRGIFKGKGRNGRCSGQYLRVVDHPLIPLQAQSKFSIRHYAGPVSYDTSEFCEKNKV
jgi:ureidoglycolate hydrolase